MNDAPPLHDPGEVFAFLRGLLAARSAGVTLVAISSSGRPEGRFVDLAGASAACLWAADRNRRGANLYWTPAETFRPVHKKPRKRDLARVFWTWADVDPKAETVEDLATERIAIEARLRGSDPDLLIDSGRGFWAFWRLDAPLEGEDGFGEAERVNRSLAAALGGDGGSWNVDKLARLPGTTNWPNPRKAGKGARPRRARVLVADWSRRRCVQEIFQDVPGAAAAFFAEEEEKRVEESEAARFAGGPSGGRAPRTTTTACVPAISLDVLERFPPGTLRIALALVDSKDKPYSSRSEAAFAFACSCARAFHRGARWLSRELVVAALLRPELPVAEHVLEQPDPLRAAWRTADRAFERVGIELARWRARRPGGRSA
jgi:hypothetical protein